MNLLSKSPSFARQLFFTISVQRLETINQHTRFNSQYVYEIYLNLQIELFYSICSLQKTAVDNTQQSDYRYSLPNGNLSNEQRQFYEKNGFIVIRNLVKPKTLDHFRQRNLIKKIPTSFSI